MKREIRVMGIDDSPFDKFHDRYCRVFGVLFRGGEYADGVVSTRIRVDGINSTTKLAEMVTGSRFRSQLRCIFLDGVNMAGFNVIDVHRLHRLTKVPVIVVIRKQPDLPNIRRVLKKLGMERKIRLIDRLGPPKKVGKIYIQNIGIPFGRAKELVRMTATRSHLPEPLRVAHLIGAAFVRGESRGDA